MTIVEWSTIMSQVPRSPIGRVGALIMSGIPWFVDLIVFVVVAVALVFGPISIVAISSTILRKAKAVMITW